MAKKDANQAVRDYLAGIGREGGKAKVAKGTATLTPEERSERGKAAAAARWGKKAAVKKAARKGK